MLHCRLGPVPDPADFGIALAMSICGEVDSAPCDRKGQAMKVRYILTMDKLLVHGEQIDSLVVDWEDESTHDEIMQVSQKWITSRNFLTERMNGLSEVGESSLTIEPVELAANCDHPDLDAAP